MTNTSDDLVARLKLKADMASFVGAITYAEAADEITSLRAKLAAAEAKQGLFQNNLRDAWAAMAMLRETVETLGPIACIKSAEYLDGPTFMHEADAIVGGIKVIEARLVTATMALEEIASLYEAGWRIKGIANEALRAIKEKP